VKYLIIIQSNPASRARWESLTLEQRKDIGRERRAHTEKMAATGELVVAEGLADVALARRVSVREGRTITQDGPFAEVKEHLAGIYLIECDSIERAVELASGVPDASYSSVEVRPIFDMSGREL
jgi:hypothetical protein